MCINVTELKILGKTYRTIGEKWENKIRYLVLTVEEEEEEVGGRVQNYCNRSNKSRYYLVGDIVIKTGDIRAVF